MKSPYLSEMAGRFWKREIESYLTNSNHSMRINEIPKLIGLILLADTNA